MNSITVRKQLINGYGAFLVGNQLGIWRWHGWRKVDDRKSGQGLIFHISRPATITSAEHQAAGRAMLELVQIRQWVAADF